MTRVGVVRPLQSIDVHCNFFHQGNFTIKIFLDSVLAGEAPSYGGSSWLVRLSRAVYEGKSALLDMWRGNPVLTALLLGLPAGFLSLIFYSICCADIMDAEEEEEEIHEKDD